MKVKIKVEKEVDLKILIVKARVRYWEYSGNIPFKDGDLWSPHIEIETGKILNWKQGVKAEIHYKVCDCLGYEIQDENGEVVLSADDGYVPSTLSPKSNGNGYGDYIIIDENGQIAKWEFNFSEFKRLNKL
jgi:hypothetical protein